MKNITGLEIDKLKLNHQKLGDLIYYEGPLLSLFVDEKDESIYYLYKWVDRNENVNRWLVTQVSKLTLKEFFRQAISLRTLILNNPVSYIIELNDDLEKEVVKVCSTSELPKEYLPSEQSFFSEERYTDFAQVFKFIVFPEKFKANILEDRISDDLVKTVKQS